MRIRAFLRLALSSMLLALPTAQAGDEMVLARGVHAPTTLSIDARALPELRSAAFMLADQETGQVILEQNAEQAVPIASITKLMTAMVVLDAAQGLSERLEVTRDDIDRLRSSRSRLPVGSVLAREDMLRLALMASENRAATALARHFPGGRKVFIEAMNRKAGQLGLHDTRFVDSTGLHAGNVASARDLVRLVAAAARYPLIREFSTTESHCVQLRRRSRCLGNTNELVRNPAWQIGVSKTGYIREAGRCLVMQAWLLGRPMIVVLLDSYGKYTRTADARRIRKWIESAVVQGEDAVTANAG